ncbi:MAG TPA: hypothetical protein VFX11_15145, partial [Candidatus Kapabacteria bacterium]|nr:hypothetical protein [Candidatus Kapabacteria bacterium]
MLATGFLPDPDQVCEGSPPFTLKLQKQVEREETAMTLQREQMSSVDTAWLRMESPVSHMTI